MVIDELNSVKQYLPLVQQKTQSDDATSADSTSFVGTLKELIGDVNSMQVESGEMTDKMIKGEPVDLHDVMISAEKAKTSFQLLLELRNKFTDLYKEISRLQV